MPKKVKKTLTFPLAGVARRRGYRKQTRPYAAPWAVNVRGVGPLEARDRGGSRPGLVKANAADFGTSITAIASVASVDSSGNRNDDLVVIADGAFSNLRNSTVSQVESALLDDNGVEILVSKVDSLLVEAYVHGATTDAYVGAVYSPNQDRIYLVPNFQADAANWHYIDCTDGSVVAYAHGATAVNRAYAGGVYSPNQDRIYLVPSDQSDETNWHYIDCTDGSVVAYAHGATVVNLAYSGGVYSPNQDRIYLMPAAQANQANWHYIDCTDGSVVAYAHGATAVSSAYIGGVYSTNQDRIYLVPAFQASQANWHYIDCSDGSVVAYVHGATAVIGAYAGGVYSPNQDRIYFVPNSQSDEANWHYVDCSDGSVVAYAHGVTAVNFAYYGGVYSPSQDRIYFAPASQAVATDWHYIDCSSGAVNAYTHGATAVDSAYYGGVYSPNQDRIYFAPLSQAGQTNWHYIDGTEGTKIIFDQTITAANPVTDTGAHHVAERYGKLYLADSELRVYDPLTGVVEVVSADAPSNQPLICMYRDRIILTGETHIWFACRQSDVTDWNFGAEIGDDARAVAGELEHAGLIGSVPKAVIPYRDKVLVFACENSLWAHRGGVTTGQTVQVSSEIGIISSNAWALSPDGLMAFLGNDGVYVWSVGSTSLPTRFSDERVPDELKNIDPTTNTINMAYDSVGMGYHLFITPASGIGTHWWLDIENRAMWPVSIPDGMQPVAVGRVEGNGIAETYLGCEDGYLRKFSAAAVDDDGTTMQSHVLLGPFRLAPDDTRDASLDEIHGIMADASGDVTWRVMVGTSAEAVADAAVTGVAAVLAGGSPVGVASSGTWSENRNLVERPRARGPWAIVWISSSLQWSYEAVAVTARQLGRLR